MKFNIEPVKNWFGFSRRERRSTVILIIIVIIILILRNSVPEKNMLTEDVTSSISEIADLSVFKSDGKPLSLQLFPFDPNTAPYDTLIRLGFAEREANTLISYRKKGGKFRQPSDIKKIYGIEEVKAERLISYVEIKADTIRKSRVAVKTRQRTLIDLNGCDSVLLMTLPGIGPVLSVRIIKYRNLLGGFASVNQLKEVYGLLPETFEIIKGRVFADSSKLIRIKINSVGYKELYRFPYFERYEVTAILKYRELKGRVESIDDLTENKLITDEKAIKVRPYLNFE